MNNIFGHISPATSRKRSCVKSSLLKASPFSTPSLSATPFEREGSLESLASPSTAYKSSGPNSSLKQVKPHKLKQLAEDIEDFCGIQEVIENSKS